jgi:SpoVK/Ycf46/Vps4 family AAA+-type ATPase
MLKVQAVTLRSKLTGYLGGRCQLQPLGGRLFSGVSGAGKTLATILIEKDLQYEVHRIDVVRMVSKYIGETEQNLGPA